MGVAEVLAAAQRRIERVPPEAIAGLVADGALVVDLRCESSRQSTGMIQGSIAIGRSVLEWRADPDCPWHDSRFDPTQFTVMVCEDGYSSSLAADSLRRIGYKRAGDIIGGITAWQSQGLPLVPNQ